MRLIQGTAVDLGFKLDVVNGNLVSRTLNEDELRERDESDFIYRLLSKAGDYPYSDFMHMPHNYLLSNMQELEDSLELKYRLLPTLLESCHGNLDKVFSDGVSTFITEGCHGTQYEHISKSYDKLRDSFITFCNDPNKKAEQIERMLMACVNKGIQVEPIKDISYEIGHFALFKATEAFLGGLDATMSKTIQDELYIFINSEREDKGIDSSTIQGASKIKNRIDGFLRLFRPLIAIFPEYRFMEWRQINSLESTHFTRSFINYIRFRIFQPFCKFTGNTKPGIPTWEFSANGNELIVSRRAHSIMRMIEDINDQSKSGNFPVTDLRCYFNPQYTDKQTRSYRISNHQEITPEEKERINHSLNTTDTHILDEDIYECRRIIDILNLPARIDGHSISIEKIQ